MLYEMVVFKSNKLLAQGNVTLARRISVHCSVSLSVLCYSVVNCTDAVGLHCQSVLCGDASFKVVDVFSSYTVEITTDNVTC